MIDAPVGARLLVLAGPGTGKTATACATVASLVRRGVPATRVLLLSFTRTAVAEVRGRIMAHLGDEGHAASVRITTLDSETWQLCHGFGTEEVKRLFGDYDANIRQLLDRLSARDELLLDHLAGFQHVIVDEAQDIVGLRAQLVVALLGALAPECGVTVFADPAQAIYGFSVAEDEGADGAGGALLDLLRAGATGAFEIVALGDVHRTSSPGLLRIFTEAREIVLGVGGHARVREAILAGADGRVGPAVEEPIDQRHSLLVMFRKRSEALLCSSQLASEGVRHRLRLPGVPVIVHPWIAQVLGTCTARSVTHDEFLERWAARYEPAIMQRDGGEAAWELLRELAPGRRDSVDLPALRSVLSRSRPPDGACAADGGAGGPVVGTIHASKGREADEVLLYLPPEPSGTSDEGMLDEETRVLFVGATRARRRLLVGKGSFLGNDHRLERTGRCYRTFHEKRRRSAAQIEIGREGDLDLASVVGEECADEETASRAQAVLAASGDRLLRLVARASKATGWRHVLTLVDDEEEVPLGRLSRAFADDLWAVAREFPSVGAGAMLRPPPEFGQLTLHGCRTVALAPDSATAERLHEPWRNSGLYLAPVLRGFSVIHYHRVSTNGG